MPKVKFIYFLLTTPAIFSGIVLILEGNILCEKSSKTKNEGKFTEFSLCKHF